MVIEPILGLLVGAAFAWLFVYSAAFVGAKHALRERYSASRLEDSEGEVDAA